MKCANALRQPTFRERVHGIYSRMKDRLKKDKIIIPFTERELEAWLLARRGSPDKPYQCRYCTGWITLMVCVLDHYIPLKQNGGAGLANLDDICEACNDIKGGLMPESFEKTIAFMRTLPPKCATDMRTRLQRANKHAGQVRSMMGRLMAMEAKNKPVRIDRTPEKENASW